jgi:DNA invertase Pin-like site-specific DNA recombinase
MDIYGYARVATKSQNLHTEIIQLKAYNPQIKIFQETISSTKTQVEFLKLLSILEKGYTLVVVNEYKFLTFLFYLLTKKIISDYNIRCL